MKTRHTYIGKSVLREQYTKVYKQAKLFYDSGKPVNFIIWEATGSAALSLM